MEDKEFQNIADIAEVISKKIRESGNPHQSIVITDSEVKLVSDERGVIFDSELQMSDPLGNDIRASERLGR